MNSDPGKLLRTICGLLLTILLLACCGVDNQQPSAIRQENPSDFALKQAWQAFAKYWQICDDVWITHKHFPVGSWGTVNIPVDTYFVLKGVSARVVSAQLSEADRLNGWTWRGTVIFTAVATREFNFQATQGTQAGWSTWGTGSQVWSCDIGNTNGKWTLKENLSNKGGSPVPCEKIPK